MSNRITPLVVLALVLLAPAAYARDVSIDLVGVVSAVNDSIVPAAPSTTGISPGDEVSVSLTYDTATGQAGGGLVSYEIVALQLLVPDTNQPGGSFLMVPADLNTATRVVFDGAVFEGLVLPNNVVGFDDLSAFGLTGVAFETSGFNGPGYRFNLGNPVVEGSFVAVEVVPSVSPAGLVVLALLAVGAASRSFRVVRRRLA